MPIPESELKGLKKRARTMVLRSGLPSKTEVQRAIECGDFLHVRGVGKILFEEIAVWCKARSPYPPYRLCPHCGKNIYERPSKR